MSMIVMAGSVPGTRHTLPGSPAWKNNQDAFDFRYVHETTVVAVACDGCSAGDHSEVGAHLIATELVDIVVNKLSLFTVTDIPWRVVREELIGYVADVARPRGVSRTAIVEKFFLSTIVGTIVTPDTVVVFSIGDGIWATDGMFYTLGPFPDNKPPYLAYALTGSTVTDFNPELLEFVVETIVNPDIRTVLIGTDGVQDLITAHINGVCYPGTDKPVGDIERLFAPEFFSNPDALRRHLALMNRETVRNGKIVAGLLPDDTTAVLIHRSSRVETTIVSQT